MRLLIQRVKSAQLSINEKLHSQIAMGLVVFVGITEEDTEEDLTYLIQKLIKLRIFSDEAGKMNLSVQEIGGSILWVSQFTLFAQTAKGNRPSYIRAARPEKAVPLYEKGTQLLNTILGAGRVETGVFGADMQVALINDGPVTIIIDSKEKDF